MMKKILKLLAVIMCFSMAAVPFTGCAIERNKDIPSVREYLEQYVAEHGRSPYAGTEIRLMHFWSDAELFFDKFAKDYFEVLGVKVNVEFQPPAGYLTVLNTKVQTGTVPEVFTMWPGASIRPYLGSNVMLDLMDINFDCKATMSQYARNAVTFDGYMPILPVNNAFIGIAYNKDIFARHNLTPPKDLDDFERIMDVIKTDSSIAYPIIYGTDTAQNMVYMMQLSVLYDKYPDFDERMAAGTINYNNPENQFIYKKLYIDWSAKGYFNHDSFTTVDRMSAGAIQFTDGNAAMMHLGSWDINVLNKLNDYNTPIGMFPMPGIDHKGNVVSAAGEAFAVSAAADGNKKAAGIELLNIIMSANINGKICGLINSLSPYTNVEVEAAPDMITELNTYLNDKARGWNVSPTASQNKRGEAVNIIRAAAGNKQSVLDEHLDTIDRIWKESL